MRLPTDEDDVDTTLQDEVAGLVDRVVRPEDGVGTYAHDWWPRLLMRRRAGEDLPVPDLVAVPASRDELVALTRWACLLYTSPSPRDLSTSRMPSSA